MSETVKQTAEKQMDELIHRHLNRYTEDNLFRSSLDHWIKHHHANGSWRMSLHEMMEEYATIKVANIKYIVHNSVCAKCGGKGYYFVSDSVTATTPCECQQSVQLSYSANETIEQLRKERDVTVDHLKTLNNEKQATINQLSASNREMVESLEKAKYFLGGSRQRPEMELYKEIQSVLDNAKKLKE